MSLTENVFPSSKTVVESVTIFSPSNNTTQTLNIFQAVSTSRAEVTRSLSLALKAGRNKVLLTGLSSLIHKRSVRVSIKGGPDTRVCDLVCTNDISPSKFPPSGSPEDALSTLQKKLAALTRKKAVQQHQLQVLLEYGENLQPKNHIGPDQVASFLQIFSEKAEQCIDEDIRLDAEILSLEKQIEELERVTKAKAGEANGQIQLVLLAENDGQAELKLTYVVSRASWKPVYELHAKTIDGKLSSSVLLNYNAQVSQSSGEDWSDTVIKLSTSSDDLNTSQKIPQFEGVKLQTLKKHSWSQSNNSGLTFSSTLGGGFSRTGGGVFGGTGGGSFGSAGGVPFGSTGGMPFGNTGGGVFGGGTASFQPLFGHSAQATAGDTKQEGFPQPAAAFGAPESRSAAPHERGQWSLSSDSSSVVVMKSSVSLIYAVKGLITIPSDGLPHQISVAKLSFDAKISHISVPWMEPNIYLRCLIKNTSDYKIFTGPVNLLFDDNLVSITALKEVEIGDEFECTLGTDPGVHLTYSRHYSPPQTEGGGFSDTFKTTDVRVKLSIRNKHSYKIERLCIQDGVPVSDDKENKVLLRKPEGLAEAGGDSEIEVKKDVSVKWKDGDAGKAKGLIEWLGSIDAGETLDLEANWVVKTPEHVNWIEAKET